MSKRAVLKDFGRRVKTEIVNEIGAYRALFPPLFDDPQLEWPTSYEKRYITLTGALRSSMTVQATSDRITIDWNTPYKNKIKYGWVTKSGAARRGRDWVALALKRHPLEDAIKRAIVSATRAQPRLCLISIT